MTEENENAFKHQFGKELLARIASSIGEVYEDFDRRRFLSLAPSLQSLEMKARVRFAREIPEVKFLVLFLMFQVLGLRQLDSHFFLFCPSSHQIKISKQQMDE